MGESDRGQMERDIQRLDHILATCASISHETELEAKLRRVSQDVVAAERAGEINALLREFAGLMEKVQLTAAFAAYLHRQNALDMYAAYKATEG